MIWKSDIWATGEVFVTNAFFFLIFSGLEFSKLVPPVDCITGKQPWGPFLESPGNVSGSKSNFQIEI